MNYNPALGPLGGLVSMGVNRIIQENNELNNPSRKLKKVKDTTFQPPIPLRGPGGRKAVSKPPVKPTIGDKSFNSGKQPLIEQVLERVRSNKNKKKKITNTEMETTTPTTSSTTTTSTTTAPSSTSTTTPSTTVKAKVNQMRLRDGLEARAESKKPSVVPPAGAKQNVTNTSSFTTTTSSNNLGTTMAKDKSSPKGFGSPQDVTTAMGKSSYADFNKPGIAESVFDTPSQTDSVKFGMQLPGTLHLNVNEVTDLSAPDFNGRFFINISSFSDAIYNSNTPATNRYNLQYNQHLSDIFYRMNKDVISNARSTVSSSWTLDNFITMLQDIAKGIECITTFDSICAYDPKLVDIYNRNDAVDEYQKLFYTTDLQTARYNLARRLKSLWFPPEFAQMMRWFYQLYRTSPLSQCAYYRYVPDGRFILTNPTAAVGTVGSVAELKAYIDGITNSLSGANTQNISSIFARLYPQGIIRNIPYSCSDAVYDDVHFEIYTNEPVYWRNPTSALETDWQVYPIIYGVGSVAGELNNEIPYYMSHNPTNDDGFAFVMQNIVGTSNTSGYVIAANTSATNTLIEGIRSFTPWRIAAASQTSVVNFNIKNCNKWIFNHTNVQFIPRCGNITYALTGNDATNVVAYTTTSATTWDITPISRPNTAHQRVYFNNRKAPELNRRVLVDKLFSIVN